MNRVHCSLASLWVHQDEELNEHLDVLVDGFSPCLIVFVEDGPRGRVRLEQAIAMMPMVQSPRGSLGLS